MAKKYSGKYSPDGTLGSTQEHAFDTRQVDAAGARANVLFAPAIVLVATSFNDGPQALVLSLVGGGVLALAAWLLRDGLRAEAAYNLRKVARRPALPRKMLASLLTGIGVTFAAYLNDSGTVGSLLYGAAGLGLHVAAFGIDPLKNKRMEGIDSFQQDRVARVVEQAEAHLETMQGHIRLLGDRTLEARVDAFQAVARKMITTVEQDPRDLTGARKFLGVYLMGARDATVKFVDLFKRTKDQSARESYDALLTDLEQNFAAKTEKLMLDDRSDMDIEIKVLRDRLQREGVSLN